MKLVCIKHKFADFSDSQFRNMLGSKEKNCRADFIEVFLEFDRHAPRSQKPVVSILAGLGAYSTGFPQIFGISCGKLAINILTTKARASSSLVVYAKA